MFGGKTSANLLFSFPISTDLDLYSFSFRQDFAKPSDNLRATGEQFFKAYKR